MFSTFEKFMVILISTGRLLFKPLQSILCVFRNVKCIQKTTLLIIIRRFSQGQKWSSWASSTTPILDKWEFGFGLYFYYALRFSVYCFPSALSLNNPDYTNKSSEKHLDTRKICPLVESDKWSRYTNHQIPCVDRSQLTVTVSTLQAKVSCLCQLIRCSMAVILCDSAVAVVHTHRSMGYTSSDDNHKEINSKPSLKICVPFRPSVRSKFSGSESCYRNVQNMQF